MNVCSCMHELIPIFYAYTGDTAMSTKQRITDRFTFKQTPYEGKKCGLYIRVSQDEFVKNSLGERERRASVDAQTQDAIAWAKKQGFEYIVYDQDCDISGSEDAINRPAITRIIADIEAGKLHTVYAREQSRFCRNEKLWHTFVWDYFFKYGVDYKDGDGTDIKTPSGRMIAGIKSGQNQTFLTENATKSMRSKLLAAERGTLRTVPPYGYGIQEIDGVRKGYHKPEEAEVIKELFSRCANGEGSQRLVNDLIARGIKSKRGKHVDAANLIRWLRNPIYKGVCTHNGKEYKSPYEPIVTPELWQQAQDQIKVRAGRYNLDRRAAANSHLLTGVIQCGYCSDILDSGKATTHNVSRNYITCLNKTWTKDGKGGYKRISYMNYRCQTKYKHHAISCPESISLNAAYIEGEVKSWIEAMIANDYGKEFSLLGSQLSKLNAEIETTKQRIAKLVSKRKQIIQDDADLKYDTESDYRTALDRVKANVAKEESRLNDLIQQRAAISGTATIEAIETLSSWDKLSIEQRKIGILKLFDRIKVYKDKLVISYRASPDSTLDIPLKFIAQKGIRIDMDEAGKLGGRRFIFSKTKVQE